MKGNEKMKQTKIGALINSRGISTLFYMKKNDLLENHKTHGNEKKNSALNGHNTTPRQ
jgi:hypothetical protein